MVQIDAQALKCNFSNFIFQAFQVNIVWNNFNNVFQLLKTILTYKFRFFLTYWYWDKKQNLTAIQDYDRIPAVTVPIFLQFGQKLQFVHISEHLFLNAI